MGALALSKETGPRMTDRSVVGSVDPTIESSSSWSASQQQQQLQQQQQQQQNQQNYVTAYPLRTSGSPPSNVAIRALLSENRRLQKLLDEYTQKDNTTDPAENSPGGRTTPASSTIMSGYSGYSSVLSKGQLSPVADSTHAGSVTNSSSRGRANAPESPSTKRSTKDGRRSKSRNRPRSNSRRHRSSSSSKRKQIKKELLAKAVADGVVVDIGDEEEDDVDDSSSKRRERIWSLRNKLKQEALYSIQMEKEADAHSLEIKCLREELHNTLTQLEAVQSERSQEKRLMKSLNKQVEQAFEQCQQLALDSKQIAELQETLEKRDTDLHGSMKELQLKNERILQLEYELEKAKTGTNKNIGPSPLEWMQAQETCKELERQNNMLKMVVEDLQEALRRRSDSDIDMDSGYNTRTTRVSSLPVRFPTSIRLDAVSQATDPSDFG